MAMASKVLKAAGNFLLTNNSTFAEGGGVTSLLIPKVLSAKGVAAAVVGSSLFKVGKSGWQASNRLSMGQVSYADGMTRMTNSYTTGAVRAMKQASQGNYDVFSDMASQIVASPGFSRVDDYGATPQMISALYGMGR